MLNCSINNSLVKVNEFAKSIDTPASTVRTWIKRKDLPAKVVLKIGNTVFIKANEFNEWCKNGGDTDVSIQEE